MKLPPNEKFKWIDIDYGDTMECDVVTALQYTLCIGNGRLVKVDDFKAAKVLYAPFKERPTLELHPDMFGGSD